MRSWKNFTVNYQFIDYEYGHPGPKGSYKRKTILYKFPKDSSFKKDSWKQIYLFDSNGKEVENWSHDEEGNLLIKSKREYDSNGNIKNEILEDSKGILCQKLLFNYDSDNQLIEIIEYSIEGKDIKEKRKQINKFDSSGNRVECISGDVKYIFNYDRKNNLIEYYGVNNFDKVTQTIPTKNTFKHSFGDNHVVIWERIDNFNDKVLRTKKITYDKNGNEIRFIYSGVEFTGETETNFIYDSRGHQYFRLFM